MDTKSVKSIKSIKSIKSLIEGDVLVVAARTLSEREMAGVLGGGPTINPGDDETGSTPSSCLYNGTVIFDDCMG